MQIQRGLTYVGPQSIRTNATPDTLSSVEKVSSHIEQCCDKEKCCKKEGWVIGGAEVTTNVSTEASSVTNIQDSEIFNRTEDYEETNTRQESIQNYIKNLVNRNQTSDEIEKNLKANIEAANDTLQENKLNLEFIDFSDSSDINIKQVNKNVAELLKSFEKFAEDLTKTINDGLQDTKLVTDVKTAMDNGNITEFLHDMQNQAEAANAQATTQDTEQTAEGFQRNQRSDEGFQCNQRSDEGFIQGRHLEAFDSKKFVLYPHEAYKESCQVKKNLLINESAKALPYECSCKEGWAVGGAEVITNVSTKTSSEFSSQKELVENVAIASVIRNTSMYNEINQSFSQVLETIKETKVKMDEKIEDKTKNQTVQRNEASITFSNAKNLKNITIEQVNEAKSSIEAATVIKAVTTMDTSNTVKAITSDMLGLTQDFTTTNETKAETKNTNAIKQSSSQITTQVSSQVAKADGLSSIIMIIVVVIVLAIVAKTIMSGRGANASGGFGLFAKWRQYPSPTFTPHVGL